MTPDELRRGMAYDPDPPKRKRASMSEIFWRHVERGGPDECWLWSGANYAGYGEMKVGGRRGVKWRAHRASYVLHIGPIPDGLCVCHRCDTPACVNPAHLFLGTDADNDADKRAKGRDRKRPLPGEMNGSAKLTAEQVVAIRASTLTQVELAAQFGVHQTTISLIACRKKWRHIQ